MSSWQPLGTVPPEELVTARLDLHWASRVLASIASSVLPTAADDSHSALAYQDGALWTQPLPGPRLYRAGLILSELQLLMRSEKGEELASLRLAERPFGHAFEWGRETVARLSPEAPEVKLRELPDFPEHRLGDGALFSGDLSDERAELARYFGNAQRLLSELCEQHADASPVQVWPHHFDIAILIPLDATEASAPRQTLGVGLSPGDESFAEPYWYVSPWPAPEEAALPVIDGPGSWQAEPFFAAVLTASEMLAASGPQPENARRFVTAAMRDGMSMLGESG